MTANAETPDGSIPRSIRVNGTGKVSAPPDKADLTLAVEVNTKTAEAARTEAANAMDAMIIAVKNAGVADKDIQTSAVSLYPTYSGDAANKINGYHLTNQITVSIHTINKASDIIDAAVQAGGNSARVQGITFGIDNTEPLLSQAREKAYANAKMKALEYARLAGVNLASPLQINEGNAISPSPMPYGEMRTMKAAMADGAATPVQAGEQEVTVNVDVIFGIR
ncbi:hypothetical protein MCAMS1_02324 [biofilm metagenome]